MRMGAKRIEDILNKELVESVRSLEVMTREELFRHNALTSEKQKLDFLVKHNMIESYSDLKVDENGFISYSFVPKSIVKSINIKGIVL